MSIPIFNWRKYIMCRHFSKKKKELRTKWHQTFILRKHTQFIYPQYKIQSCRFVFWVCMWPLNWQHVKHSFWCNLWETHGLVPYLSQTNDWLDEALSHCNILEDTLDEKLLPCIKVDSSWGTHSWFFDQWKSIYYALHVCCIYSVTTPLWGRAELS